MVAQRRRRGWVVGCTYDRSSGVAGVDPAVKLCAKVAPPPSCLVAGFCMAPELMGPTPPNAQPEPLFTGGIAASPHQHHCRNPFARVFDAAQSEPPSPYPVFHLVICLLLLFLYVALVGFLRNHQASLLGSRGQLLTNRARVSLGSFDRPGMVRGVGSAASSGPRHGAGSDASRFPCPHPVRR